MALDMDFVRAAFPALASDMVFMDNAGGSQVLRRVAERIHDYLLTTSVQLGASYETSERASGRVQQARSAVARFMNAGRPEEIVFGSSTTLLLRLLATAMASQLQPGDEIVVTVFDHESNIGPWRMLEERGIVIRQWDIDPRAMEPDLDDLEELLGPRTRLVAVTHASNIFGTIMPVAEIARRVHAHGAKICVDGVAYAPHRAIDVTDWDVDYYVFSFYKVYGPHFAALYGKYDALAQLDGLYHYFYGREAVPAKLEPGNTIYELAWGSAGIVDYVDALGGGTGERAAIERAFADIAAQEEALSERVLSWLRARNDVTIVGRKEADRAVRVPTISFKVHGRDSMQITRRTDADRIGIRHGDFHSRRLVERLGLSEGGGLVRVSMVHYNTLDEANRLIASFDRAL